MLVLNNAVGQSFTEIPPQIAQLIKQCPYPSSIPSQSTHRPTRVRSPVVRHSAKGSMSDADRHKRSISVSCELERADRSLSSGERSSMNSCRKVAVPPHVRSGQRLLTVVSPDTCVCSTKTVSPEQGLTRCWSGCPVSRSTKKSISRTDNRMFSPSVIACVARSPRTPHTARNTPPAITIDNVPVKSCRRGPCSAMPRISAYVDVPCDATGT